MSLDKMYNQMASDDGLPMVWETTLVHMHAAMKGVDITAPRYQAFLAMADTLDTMYEELCDALPEMTDAQLRKVHRLFNKDGTLYP